MSACEHDVVGGGWEILLFGDLFGGGGGGCPLTPALSRHGEREVLMWASPVMGEGNVDKFSLPSWGERSVESPLRLSFRQK